MALVLKDRVKQVSTTNGTGSLSITSTLVGYQTFESAIGVGNTTYYTIYHENTVEWEVGIGTVGSGTISRDTILASSNGGALVDFTTGNKAVWCDYPAEKAIYTDASGNISNLNGSISIVDNIGFDTTYSTTLGVGQLGWDGNNTLGIGMAGGNVVQKIGEDQFFYCKAASAITKGQVIMFTGAVGASGVPTGAPATGITDGTYIMGVAAESIAHNGFGLIQTFGTLRNVNTSGYADGDILWYNPSVTGGLTSTKPSAPNVKVQVAAVINGGSAGGGTILIRINAGSVLGGTDSNVQITSPTTGQSLIYNSGTGIWTNGNNEVINGGTIDATPIGATTPSTGSFTTLTAQTEVLKGTGQNFLIYSEQLDNAAWTPSFVTVSANATTAPDGTLTADKVIPTAPSNSFKEVQQNFTSVIGATYTISCYVKSAGYQYVQLLGSSAQMGTFAVNYDLSTGTETYFTAGTSTVVNRSITSVGNGWYRISASVVSLASGSSRLGVDIVSTSTATRGLAWASDGTSGIYQWGMQVELASTVGTYIPTTTTAIYGTPSLSFSGVAGIGLESNGSLYHQPAGTGAVQAQATTSSAVGGNARGAYAVDWQMLRGNAANVASGAYAGALSGLSNTVNGFGAATCGGNSNQNSSSYGFVGGGQYNNASGTRAGIASGQSNAAAGYYNFIGGGYTNSGTANAAVTTQSGTMNGTTAVTLSGSNASIKVGQYIAGTSIAAETYVAAISGTSLTLSQAASGSSTSTLSFYTPHGVVVGGGNNQATGSYSFIGGGGDAGTAANRNVASGDWSVVCGGQANIASGAGAVVGGGGTNGAAIGANTASGATSVIAGGFAHTATGIGSSIIGGTQNLANSNRSSVLGGRFGTTRGIIGNAVLPACEVPLGSSAGLSQSALLVLAVQTTDATATVLRSDTGAASTTNQVILPNNSAYYFRGEIVAGKTAGGDTKGWFIEGVIKRGATAGSTAMVGTPTVTSNYADAGASTWTVAVAADTTNGGLKITVTGQAATTIRWVAQVRTTEMTF